MVIKFNNELYSVFKMEHRTPGNLRGFVQAKMRRLSSGTMIEHRFSSEDRVERAILDEHEMEYLYDDGDAFHFMNTENFDQLEMSEDDLGDSAQWVAPSMKIMAEFFNGRPIGIQLPNAMVFEVAETNPVMKTATKSASFKPAKLDNGVMINVPEFIQTGEKVRVNPTTGEYIDRAK